MVRSLYSGVSGLKSHQTRMDVIGNNIANVNTYGFKASRTSFADIYYQASRSESGGRATFAGNNSSQVGYGVQVASIDKDMSMSNLQNTNRTLDLAIAGDGMFVVGTVDRGGKVSSVYFTRMGNFGVDSAGNLVNALNEFVLGTKGTLRIDGGSFSTNELNDKNPADKPNEMDVLNINDLVWDAFKPQAEYDFDDVDPRYKDTEEEGPSYLKTIFSGKDPYNDTRNIAYDRNISEFELRTDSDMPTPEKDSGETQTGDVAADYILYNVNGKYVNNQGVIFDPEVGLYTDKDGNYYEYTCSTSKDDTGKVSKTHTYLRWIPNEEGELSRPENEEDIAKNTFIYKDVSKTWEAPDGRGNTLYANMTDGSLKYSDLEGFTIGGDGIVTAKYASQMMAICRLDVATFDNIEGLNEVGNTEFSQTAASGEAHIKRPGESGAGKTQSNKLEMSNVNLANEFSDMIVTQRGYQANARIITTSDSMLEELVNLKR